MCNIFSYRSNIIIRFHLVRKIYERTKKKCFKGVPEYCTTCVFCCEAAGGELRVLFVFKSFEKQSDEVRIRVSDDSVYLIN